MLGAFSYVFNESMPALTIAIDFVHIFWRDSDDTALLNHLWILPDNGLDNL
jgi:hypothetical protein